MGNNAGQISENTLQAIEIVAQSVVDKAETSITRDCVVSEIVDVTTGLYTVSTGYSSFSAYSLNQAQYAVGDLVYVQMPAGSGSGDKIILGRRQSGSDAYEFADTFADTVFFNGRENSLIKLTSPVGLIANGNTANIHLGRWTGEYTGVTKMGLEGSFNTLLKILGTVEGTYGLKLITRNNVGNIEEFDFPCSECYGNPYNYIYSTRVNKLFTYTTQQTLVQIDAYVYQNSDFRDDNEFLVAVAQSANILLDNLYIGVGKLGSEILGSKLTITPYNGSRVYAEGGDATLLATFDKLAEKIGIENLAGQGSEAIQMAISNAQIYDALNADLAEDETPVQFTSTQITRINQWIENRELVSAIDAGTISTSDFQTQGHNSVLLDLSVESPLITFSLVVNTESTPEYLMSTPTFADEVVEAEFIRWFKANREAEITNLTIPSELQSGWELIETGVTDDGYLVFSPDFTKDSETLIALIQYKEKYYISNELVLTNQVNAIEKKIEETKSELIDQAAKDKELIEANQRAINSLVIESGYFETDESGAITFKQNNGLFYYYTRSGVIRENDKSRAYGLRCYSTDPNTVIQNLTWTFPQGNTMIRQHEDGYYQENGGNIYPRSLITIDRKYSPGKTNNIVVVTTNCDVTSGGATQQLILENQIELSFGYYSCEGTEHTLTAYWTNGVNEIVNCLTPGKTYTAHLVLDGKEVVNPKWEAPSGGEYGNTYTPDSANEVHMRKGVATLSNDLSLGCWLGAKLSYNEDNIIEGMTQLIYQSDGTTHLRDGISDADVSPQYRLELLLEDAETHNQQYADGIYWDPYTGIELSDNEVYDRIVNIESRKLNTENSTTNTDGVETKKELVNGFAYDENGEKATLYFSGPSNWSIGVHYLNGSLEKEYFMRDVDSTYEKWSQGISVDCPYFSLVYSPPTSDESVLLRSTVDLQMKGVYIETMSQRIFTINIYTYTGYLLARIPLRIDVNRYPSIYIDKMAQYNGLVHIDDDLGVIYSPRFLAGTYEEPNSGTGNRQFSGVAIGDFAHDETEVSMGIPGIYGFKQGLQAYAFRNDGTGFIGANSNTRITFNNGGRNEEVLTIGDTNSPVFSVEADGDVNLKGSVTGTGNNGGGYQLNKDGTGYIISSKYDEQGNLQNDGEQFGIYFKPATYPIYISNSAYKDDPSNAAFSVKNNGDINLKGSNVHISDGDHYVNINGSGIQLNGNVSFTTGSGLDGYVTDGELSNAEASMQEKMQALSNKVDNKQIDSEQFADALKDVIDNSQGLYWDSTSNKLTINASQINGAEIKGISVSASNITAGTLDGFTGTDGIGLNNVFNAYRDGQKVGQFGMAKGSLDTTTSTNGIGMVAGSSIKLDNLGSLDSATFSGGGAYAITTESGFRSGYYWDTANSGTHNYILITSAGCTLCSGQYSLNLNTQGTLTLKKGNTVLKTLS